MKDSDMKDSDILENFDPKFEKFQSKDCNDFEVSSRKFESFDTKVSEVDESGNGILEVSSGNFESFDTKDCENSEVSIGNFQSSESTVLKIDGRTKPRNQNQIDTVANFVCMRCKNLNLTYIRYIYCNALTRKGAAV